MPNGATTAVQLHQKLPKAPETSIHNIVNAGHPALLQNTHARTDHYEHLFVFLRRIRLDMKVQRLLSLPRTDCIPGRRLKMSRNPSPIPQTTTSLLRCPQAIRPKQLFVFPHQNASNSKRQKTAVSHVLAAHKADGQTRRMQHVPVANNTAVRIRHTCNRSVPPCNPTLQALVRRSHADVRSPTSYKQ